MPKLVDTTIRLLSQEPLAGSVPTGEVLRIAEILDGAGFACLEVSGGGAFDAAVRRGVESPWERVRALADRTETPLGMALRGRFLVGSRPVSRPTSCAASSRARPRTGSTSSASTTRSTTSRTCARPARRSMAAGKVFHVGLVYSPGRPGEVDTLVEQARGVRELGATMVIVNDQAGALLPHLTQELVERLAEETGLPVGPLPLGRGRHRARQRARRDAGRCGGHLGRRVPARARAAPHSRRVARRGAARARDGTRASTSTASGRPRT